MHLRRLLFGIALLTSLLTLSCSGGRSPEASNPNVSSEHSIRVPGEYVARREQEEVFRGAPSRSPARASPPPTSEADVLAGLPLGRVLFSCPQQMTVQKTERVEVRISGNAKQNLQDGLQSRGIPVQEATKIAPVMKVTLSPDQSGVFEVKALSEEQQLTSNDDLSQWVWIVTPLQSGTHNIYLTVNVVVDVPGFGQQKRQIPVLTQAVQVKANEGYSARQFWGSNWQWFTSTLLIPLFVWLWSKRKKSKV